MGYKLLYIEDLDPRSIVSDLKVHGFDIIHFDPGTFENLVTEIGKIEFEGILFDFRLTQGNGRALYDAPTIAQTQRTKSSTTHKHYPIFLISTEANISAFYDDFTSNDLFDISISKETFQKDLDKFCKRLKDCIDAYKIIEDKKFNLASILNISKEKLELLDYRFVEKFNDPTHKNNTFKISRLIYNSFVRTIGELIGEDVLSARLGISMKSEGWQTLRDAFDNARYSGIYSKSHYRWWAKDVLEICEKKYEIKNLRRLNANDRADKFIKIGFENIEAVKKLEFSDSSNFWTICKELQYPIDPVDGLELISKEIIPWQDTEYISLYAAMKSSPFIDKLKTAEKERFLQFANSIKK